MFTYYSSLRKAWEVIAYQVSNCDYFLCPECIEGDELERGKERLPIFASDLSEFEESIECLECMRVLG